MPYSSTSKLPASVRNSLPKHAQAIYRKAFENAWEEYKAPEKRRGQTSREEAAHKVAWSAVKTKYKKNGTGEWSARGGNSSVSTAKSSRKPTSKAKSAGSGMKKSARKSATKAKGKSKTAKKTTVKSRQPRWKTASGQKTARQSRGKTAAGKTGTTRVRQKSRKSSASPQERRQARQQSTGAGQQSPEQAGVGLPAQTPVQSDVERASV